MHYRLRDGVSYCRIDGSLIFLDLDADRYFCLSRPLEAAFLAALHDGVQTGTEVSDLVQRRILVPRTGMAPQEPEQAIPMPSLSALEHGPITSTASVSTVLEVASTVVSTRIQLRVRPLRDLIAGLTGYRRRWAAKTHSQPPCARATLQLEHAGMFRQARRYVPIETSCLLDSIAMLRFLARRRISADLVFGVTHHPFAAHCWVQAGDWVLNDTVGNVFAHTPIRRI